MKRVLMFLVLIGMLFAFFGCSSDAYVASQNLSKEADMFRIYRRAIFYNGITGDYILQMEGYLSITDQGDQLEVTVKNDNGTYLKHFLGLSDNVTYFVEQLDSAMVSDNRYKVFFKPSTIIPMVEVAQ